MAQPTLRRGSRGEEVSTLQEILRKAGVYKGKIDGVFGPATDAAVREYQRSHAIAVDGVVGRETWGKINEFGGRLGQYGRDIGAAPPPGARPPGPTPPRAPPPSSGLGKPSALPKPSRFTPPKVPKPKAPVPKAQPPTITEPQRANARAELRRILDAAGLGDLAEIAWALYVQGVRDPDQLIFELEGTEEFRRRFPGIRDVETGEFIMDPGSFLNYERGIRERASAYGFRHLSRAEVGAIVTQRRSLSEIEEDFAALAALQTTPYLREQFFGYTGIDPGPEGLLALTLGLPQAEALREAYEQSVEAGVSLDEFNARLRSIRERNRTLEQVTGALRPGEDVFSATPPQIPRLKRLEALKRAELAARAPFEAGGQQIVERELAAETF